MRATGSIVIFLVIFVFRSFSQNKIGIPDIINYQKDNYNAGTQNSGIVQDKNGLLYFANYEGLLIFEGPYWKTYPLPNPNLSVHELKLCAYLRMNLSSKEIAQLESISVRGVEISRYSLRKKSQITKETNLFELLLEFSSSKTG